MGNFTDRKLVFREQDGLEMFSVGRDTFRKKIAPRLDGVKLSAKARGYTFDSAQRLLAELVAEAINAPPYQVAANLPEHAGKRGRKRHAAKR